MTDIGIYDITITQGETWSVTMTFTNDDGSIIDLSGYTIKMQIRKDYNDTIYQELNSSDNTIDISQAQNGIVIFNLTSTQTGAYDFDVGVYDIKFTASDNTVKYYVKGVVKINRSITI